MKDKNSAAVALGQLSAKSRFKGMTKKQISEKMAEIRAHATIPNSDLTNA